MKIKLRILCKQDAKAFLAQDPQVAAVCNLDAVGPLELDSDEPVFDRFLAVTCGTSGCWFNPIQEFTRVEMVPVRYFQLECRKLVREGPGDYEINIARLRNLPFFLHGEKIRLLDRIALSRASLKPNEIACAGDWMAEFITHREVGRIFEIEGLTGFTLHPVLDPKARKDYEDVFQLYTESLMPQAELDLTTPPHPDFPDKKPRQLACLTYDFRDGSEPTADFNRTAEAWSSNDMPVWVISSRVREIFNRHKLRGWAFRPVLEKGTSLHDAYLAKWQNLMGRISASNPRHFF
jgi:hypothetical protein